MSMAFIFIFNKNALGKTLVISDVDDTIKVTDVLGSKIDVVYNGLFSKKKFSGMSELYQRLNKKDTVIYYVTGSPQIIKGVVNEFLEDNFFPQSKNLILKNKIKDDTFNFKLEAIRKLIGEIKPDEMILIGDDTEFDSDVYTQIAKENPGQVKSIYIRAVQNKILQNQNFFSPVEIAGAEFFKGRLSFNDLQSVANGFFKQEKNSKLAITNRYCPREGRVFIETLKQYSRDQKLIDLFEKTQEKIIETCLLF